MSSPRSTPSSPKAASIYALPEPQRHGLGNSNIRASRRIACPFEVRSADDGTAFRGLDISLGGLRCVGTEPIWPGNALLLDLRLPGEAAPLQLRGRVLDLLPVGDEVAMRIQFEDVSPKIHGNLAHWLGRSMTRLIAARASPGRDRSP